MVDCDRCGHPIPDPDDPATIGELVLCDECHDKICGNCGSEIPDPEDQYDIPPVGPGTTCPTCTARYVEWMCNGCGAELDDDEQVRISEGSQYDGTYCTECAPEARERAQSDPAAQDEEAPF